MKLLIIFLLFFSLSMYAQTNPNFGQRIIIGSSLTWISDNDGAGFGYRFNEYTWEKNIAVNVNKSLYLGLSHKHIWSNGSTVMPEGIKDNYYMFGAFGQYDFFPKRKMRLFAELSLNRGNYCTCYHLLTVDPFKVENLNYLGTGGGVDLPITKFLSVDFSFMVHNILNDVPRKYAYNIYIVGLNFDFMGRAEKR